MRPWLVFLLLPACAGQTSTDNASAEDTSADSAGTTWYEDVEPLVQKSCATCHDGGGVGGVNLTDAATAQAYAGAMAAMVSAGAMPPPAADPACRDYGGSERMNLTADERAVFQAWYDEGAKAGDPARAPAPVSWGTSMEDPDVVLTMPFEHPINADVDGNEYFCVEVENPLTETGYITGLDVLTGNPSVVHHMILIKDESGDAGVEYGVTDPSAGFDCRDPMMEDDWTLLHAWAPGMDQTNMVEGMGMAIEPGDQLILQMHYFATAADAGATDQSSYLLRLDSQKPAKEVQLIPFGPAGFRIPADEDAHSESEDFYNSYVPITVYGVFPHMHLLGTDYHGWVDNADGTQDCLAQGRWDFDHQAFYMFDEPYTLDVGDSLVAECTWDNSASNPAQYNDPAEAVNYGEGTNEEMCYFLYYASI